MDHIASASPAELLNGAGAAVSAGTVNVISVKAIRDSFGERWPKKRDQVETFLTRSFARLAGPGAIIRALNEIEFITIQADVSAAAAVNLSANILKDTLGFFIGAAAEEDMHILQVTAFVGGRLEVQALDPARLMAAAAGAPQPSTLAPSAAPAVSDAAAPPSQTIARPGRRPPVRLASRGLEVEVASTLTPVWNITAGVVASTQLTALVAEVLPEGGNRPVDSADVTPALAAQIALHALREAMGQACADPAAPSMAIHAPLPLPALSYSTSRYALLHALRDLDPLVRRRLVLEITELPEGFPSGRLAELVSMLAPLGRAVLARAASAGRSVRHWRDCRLNGVILDCAEMDPADKRVGARLSAFAEAVDEAAPRCIAYGLNDRSLLLAAWGAGFSHLAGPALSAVVGPRQAVRLDPEDFYAAINSVQPPSRSAA